MWLLLFLTVAWATVVCFADVEQIDGRLAIDGLAASGLGREQLAHRRRHDRHHRERRRKDASSPLQPMANRRGIANRRPNVVFLLTDDQDIELGSMDFMPKTMKIMGDGGAHFPNAYVTTPMCCPSRSSILTGLYSHNHNVYTNNDNCSSLQWQNEHESRTFATYLSNAGYRTAYFGKYLNEYNGSYIPPGWREWAALVRNSRFYNYTLNVNGRKIKHGENYEVDYYPDLIVNDSIAFLRRSKQFFPNKPVTMVLSFPSPHGPEDAAPQFQHLFHNVTTHKTPTWNYAPNGDKQWILRHTGKMAPIHEDFTDLLHTKRLQTLQSVDIGVERLYNELVALGEEDNTYIVYTSDHGYHLGQFGLVKGKSMPFEFDVRVPFFVRGPNVPAGIKIQDIVLNIDIAPSLLDFGGVNVPEHMDGRSIFPVLLDTYHSMRNGKGNDVQVNRNPVVRDTFLIERGKAMKESNTDIERKNNTKLNKRQWLEVECRKVEYHPPCSPTQKWECFVDKNNEYRIRKCRKQRWNGKRKDANELDRCTCDDETDQSGIEIPLDANYEEMRHAPDSFSDVVYLDALEKRLQRRFLKEHVNQNFRPIFIGSRNRREIHDSLTGDTGNDVNEVSTRHFVGYFDVEGVFELNRLLDSSLSRAVNLSNSLTAVDTNLKIARERNHRKSGCVVHANNSINCPDEVYTSKHVWRQKKDRLDNIIKKLQTRLVELKDIRRHLKEKRPSTSRQENVNKCSCKAKGIPRNDQRSAYLDRNSNKYSKGSYLPSRRHYKNDYDDDNDEEDDHHHVDYIDDQHVVTRRRINSNRHPNWVKNRWKLRDSQMRKKHRKLKRKIKFFNTTCNFEKMNCFTHDNDHWKTAPFWTKGPFCFCQNSNNNSFWCLRTINATHNFLYCEFVTGFITYYDLRIDPYQMKNAVYELDFGVLEQLKAQLNHMKTCKGAKECNVKHTPQNDDETMAMSPGKSKIKRRS